MRMKSWRGNVDDSALEERMRTVFGEEKAKMKKEKRIINRGNH